MWLAITHHVLGKVGSEGKQEEDEDHEWLEENKQSCGREREPDGRKRKKEDRKTALCCGRSGDDSVRSGANRMWEETND